MFDVDAYIRRKQLREKDAKLISELYTALKQCRTLIDHFMPFVGKIALPDYKLLNEAQINADKIIKKIEESP